MAVEQTLQEGMLQRHVMTLIVAHLRDHNLIQAATAVANATMTPLNSEVPQNKLLDLVRKGMAAERDEIGRGAAPSVDMGMSASGGAMSAGYGPLPALPTMSLDFSSVQETKGSSKIFPKHDSRHVSEHKNVARCARFSPDGRLIATGSADTSIKLFEMGA